MSFQPYYFYRAENKKQKKRSFHVKATLGFFTPFLLVALVVIISIPVITHMVSRNSLQSRIEEKVKNNHEVFGFAPHWTLGKLDNIDFSILTTFAYFGLPLQPNGNLDTKNNGYLKFYSQEATDLFDKAHDNGTRVVVTITQMNNDEIKKFLNDSQAQQKAISNIVSVVKERRIDGVNVDFEYLGDPGGNYKEKFSQFVANLTDEMHQSHKDSHVTVSVYASAMRDPKMYDIKSLASSSDGIFMMAYDFATTGSNAVIPTAPLYGYKEGKYWYDISTAVDAFLTVMPKEKLILGLPWYGYNYPVNEPAIKAEKNNGYYTSYWYRGRKYSKFVARPHAYAATYATVMKESIPDQEGWDDVGQVGWKAYQENDGWRMLFLDDVRSLGIKYDFAKSKGLGGVGMWAMGFDNGNTELWELLATKFGQKMVASNIIY